MQARIERNCETCGIPLFCIHEPIRKMKESTKESFFGVATKVDTNASSLSGSMVHLA